MANEEPADGSSSQSDRLSVVTIGDGDPGRGVVAVTLDDGSRFFFSAAWVEEQGLGPGFAMRRTEWEAASDADEERRCERLALALLARREHSRFQLGAKLLRRGFPEQRVCSVLDRLWTQGHLSDLRYAYAWAESRLRHRHIGPRLVVGGLLARGVGRNDAEEALRQLDREGVIDEALRKAWERNSRHGDVDGDAVERRLIRQGWHPSRVRSFREEIR